MSLLARDRSATLVCSSVLTVASSSLTDCISSLEVSSSSLVLCSSSLTDCISSLLDLSSSLEVSSSSLAARRYSSLARSSSLSSAICAPRRRAAGRRCGRLRRARWACQRWLGGVSPASPDTAATPARRPGRPATGHTLRLTGVKWPLVLTRTPRACTVLRLVAALCRVGEVAAQAFTRHFQDVVMPASPGAGSRYMPVRPCR